MQPCFKIQYPMKNRGKTSIIMMADILSLGYIWGKRWKVKGGRWKVQARPARVPSGGEEGRQSSCRQKWNPGKPTLKRRRKAAKGEGWKVERWIVNGE
jgi:hypothetical protein